MIKKVILTIFACLLFSYRVFAWDSCLLSDNESKLKCEKEVYIETNISTIANEYWVNEVLWWTFFVTNFEWIDENKTTVEFEDGHIMIIAEIIFDTDNKITEFKVIYPEDNEDVILEDKTMLEKKTIGTLKKFFLGIINFFRSILK